MKIGRLRFEYAHSLGKLLCYLFGHRSKRLSGRCSRCLFLLDNF